VSRTGNRFDPYPSRIGGEAQVLPRKDPVVYATDAAREAGPLSAERLASFERNGFLTFQTLVEDELRERLAAESTRLFHERRDDPSPRVVREPEDDEVRSIFAVHEDEELFRSFVRHPMLVAMAEQVLGGPAYVHQSRINYKPAFRGQPFHWHSDFETWHVEDGMPRMRAFSLSLNLTENRMDNGPLMVVPESHHHYVCCAGETPEAHYERSLRRQEAGTPPDSIVADLVRGHGIESPTGPAGSATLFDCNVMHGSNGNITPFARTNVFLVFNSVENVLEAPFSGQPARPEHIASRHVAPLP
jgi:ectoine hydroxylase